VCRSGDFVLCCIVHVGEKRIAAVTASDILKYFVLTIASAQHSLTLYIHAVYNCLCIVFMHAVLKIYNTFILKGEYWVVCKYGANVIIIQYV